MIIISDHARDRFRTRWIHGGTVEKVAQRALKKGITNGRLREDVSDKAIYKLYKKTVFVFFKEQDGMVLATLFIRERDKERKLIHKTGIDKLY